MFARTSQNTTIQLIECFWPSDKHSIQQSSSGCFARAGLMLSVVIFSCECAKSTIISSRLLPPPPVSHYSHHPGLCAPLWPPESAGKHLRTPSSTIIVFYHLSHTRIGFSRVPLHLSDMCIDIKTTLKARWVITAPSGDRIVLCTPAMHRRI